MYCTIVRLRFKCTAQSCAYKNPGLKPFQGTKKAPKRGKSTGDRGRTDTPLLERDFESRASANSATPA